MVLLENENKLQFIVDNKATKHDIKRGIEKAFDQKVKHVCTLMSMHGEKKAVVSFENEKAAEEILSCSVLCRWITGRSNYYTEPGQGRPDLSRPIPPV